MSGSRRTRLCSGEMIGSKRSIRSVAAIALVLVAAAVSMVVAQEGRDAAGNRRPVNTTLITLEFSGYWASGRLDVASDGTCALQTPSRGWPAFPGVLGGFPAVLDAMPRPCVVPPRLFARLRAAVSAVRWRCASRRLSGPGHGGRRQRVPHHPRRSFDRRLDLAGGPRCSTGTSAGDRLARQHPLEAQDG